MPKNLNHREAVRKNFSPARGVRGHAPPENFENPNLSDWLKLLFWLLDYVLTIIAMHLDSLTTDCKYQADR